MIRVAVLDDYQYYARDRADWSRLSGRADVEFFADHLSDPDALAKRLAPFDVVVCMRERTPVRAELLRRLSGLRLIVTTGLNNASIDLATATDQGVIVCATRAQRYADEQLAETTWALILAAVKNLPSEAAAVRAGKWQQSLGTGLSGNRLGVVGLGRIGAEVARLGIAFGMDVCAWSEHLDPQRAAELGVTAVPKRELFASSDVVSLHLRLSGRSAGTVGREELAAMKPTALLVNTSRGELTDEAALISTLRSGGIRGAALDVFTVEPLPPDHPFRTLPNVIATPHIGYVTEEMYTVFFADIVSDIEAFLDGSPVRVIS
jgi:phosphoglycerate dehydrogenase-like enzyme